MLIEDLGFSVRTYKCLKRAKIATVAQLRIMEAKDLLKIRGFGMKCLFEVQEKVDLRPNTAKSPNKTEITAEDLKTAFSNGAAAMRQRVLQELDAYENRECGFIRTGLTMAQAVVRDMPCPERPVVVMTEGFQAFRGLMLIVPKAPGRQPEEIRGDWLYKPDTDCWYCKGRSYPAEVCEIIGV